MKYLLTLSLSLLAVSSALAQSAWEKASYAVLEGADGDTPRTLHYLDSSGNPLGSQKLETSNFTGANAIAYGSAVCPNLGGAKGLVLLRTSKGTATETKGNWGRAVNFYSDPLASSGPMLKRLPAIPFGSINGAPVKPPQIDYFTDLDAGKNGQLMALVHRKGGTPETSYIYRYNIKVEDPKKPSISRDGFWGIGAKAYKAFAFGAFIPKSDADEQFALLGLDDKVEIRGGKYSSESSAALKSFSISQAGKQALRIWAQKGNLCAVYNDNTVIVWNPQTGAEAGRFAFNPAVKNVLDVVAF